MRYKKELLNCYERKETIEKVRAIINFIEDKERKYNKEIDKFTKEEIREIFDNIKDYYIKIDKIETDKEEIFYYIRYYFELVYELEKNK